MDVCRTKVIGHEPMPDTIEVLGMVVARIDSVPAMRSGMELVTGLIVTMVRLGSMADLAGVATGDILCEVDGCPVADTAELEQILAEHDSRKPVGMLFRRVGAWRYLALPHDVDSLSPVHLTA